MYDKEKLRLKFLQARDNFSGSARRGSLDAIVNRLVSSELFDDSYCVMLYSSFGSEVQTDGIIQNALSRGKQVCLPVIEGENVHIEPYKIKSIGDLILGKYKIYQPNTKTCTPVDPKDIDLVIVPGVAFDNRGNRLGYGKGYYDRFLPQLSPKAITVGLAFEIQVAVNLPQEQHDIRVKRVITDVRMITCTL